MTEKVKTASDIKNWLITQGKNRKANGFVIDYTEPTIASTLAVSLCVNSLKGCKALVTEESNNVLKDQNVFVDTIEILEKDPVLVTMNSAKIAVDNNCLIVQPYNVLDMKLIRPWPARYCLVADLLPFASMLYRDVKAMFASIADMESESTKTLFEQESRLFYSNDVKVSVDELEWAYYSNFELPRFRGIVTGSEDPARHNMWPMLTMRQKSVIALLHQRHKSTNNRIANPLEF